MLTLEELDNGYVEIYMTHGSWCDPTWSVPGVVQDVDMETVQASLSERPWDIVLVWEGRTTSTYKSRMEK